MVMVIDLLVIGIMLAVPLATIGCIICLCRTIGDGRSAASETASPWSCRLYSASKRATLAWVAEMAFCAVTYAGFGFYDVRWLPANCHYFLMVAIGIAAFVWGFVLPRTYTDGAERVKNGRARSWTALAILLFFVFSVVFLVSRIIVPFRNVESGSNMIEIRAAKWNPWEFRMASIAPNIIPWDATDIELRFTPITGLLPLGGYAELRCKVERNDLLAFAKTRGYEFQSESIERNACTNGCGDCDFVGQVWRKYNGYDPYPADFLAYNYRYATCGGYSFLYDVANATLYAVWSSN